MISGLSFLGVGESVWGPFFWNFIQENSTIGSISGKDSNGNTLMGWNVGCCVLFREVRDRRSRMWSVWNFFNFSNNLRELGDDLFLR